MENNTQTIITKNERPNSYEFGKASARVKVYFDKAEDLKITLDQLKDIGVPNENMG